MLSGKFTRFLNLSVKWCLPYISLPFIHVLLYELVIPLRLVSGSLYDEVWVILPKLVFPLLFVTASTPLRPRE